METCWHLTGAVLDEPAIGVDTAKITESEKKNVQMHIQDHDHDHGVGWCAKIVFFTLMAILAGLVVLIVLENRGGSDREYMNWKFRRI